MFTIQKIQSLDLPALQPYRTMRRQLEHRQAGIFVAEGEKVVRRLLESRWTVQSVLCPEKWAMELEPLLRARPEHVETFIAEKKLLETLTGFSMYQGLLAVGKIPEAPALLTVLAQTPRPHLLAAVDSLSSAENLGALVRNCVAFQVDALLVGETCCSPFLRRAVRSSMGTVFQLPIIETNALAETLRNLKRLGVRCLAAHTHARQCAITGADFRSDCCIVFGSEGHGIAPAVLDACHEAVAIPMPPEVDSLNVASAAAVFLYEANRQRGAAPVAR